MENSPLRPSLPWRRVMPGTYAAETPSGHTYKVEKTDADWRVILLGPRGGREVLGEPTRIKWLGQCRAEYHYLHVLGGKAEAKPAASPDKAAAPVKPRPQAAPPKAAAPKAATPPPAASKPAASARKAEKPASRRHRRPAAEAAKPAAPVKPATTAASPLPAETLAWKVSQRRGREFHVAEHDGGLFKILEVKGTEGFALFDEKSDGVVHEIRCGSLEACKQAAASRYMDNAPRASKAGEKHETGKRAPAGAAAKASDGEGAKPKTKPAPAEKAKSQPAKASEAASEIPDDGACGCQHPEETPAPPSEAPKPKPASKPKAKDRDTKILAGLQSALRKMKPPTAAEA